jgi:hypothetical protein
MKGYFMIMNKEDIAKQKEEIDHHVMLLNSLFIINRAEISAYIVDFIKKSFQKMDMNSFISYFKYTNFYSRQTWFQGLSRILSCPVEHQPYLLGMASLNHNGYVREEALKKINELNYIDCFPYILMRLSDNVPIIRILAAEILTKTLPQQSILTLLDNIKLIEWLSNVEKINLHKYQNDIYKILASHEDSYINHAPSLSVKQKLFFLKAIKLYGHFSEAIMTSLLKDIHEKIRYFGVDLLHFDRDQDAILKAIDDKTTEVKFLAMTKIPKDKFSEYRALFIAHLTHKSKSIREFARFVLKHEGFDFIGYYRETYNTNPNSATNGLKLGLCEKSEAQDADLLRGFLNASSADLRATSLYAINQLEENEVTDYNLHALKDSNSQVRRVAVTALIPDFKAVKALEELLLVGKEKEKWAAFRVLIQKSSDIALNAIITAINFEGIMCHQVYRDLYSWYNKHNVQPRFTLSKEQYDRFQVNFQKLKINEDNFPYAKKQFWQGFAFLMKAMSPRK